MNFPIFSITNWRISMNVMIFLSQKIGKITIFLPIEEFCNFSPTNIWQILQLFFPYRLANFTVTNCNRLTTFTIFFSASDWNISQFFSVNDRWIFLIFPVITWQILWHFLSNYRQISLHFIMTYRHISWFFSLYTK